MKEILILGGNQFVRRALATTLLERENKVYVLNRGSRPAPAGAIQLTADRDKPRELADILRGLEFDVVVDVSAYHPGQTRTALEYLSNNTKHFIHISSAAVYQEISRPVKEEDPTGPNPLWGDYSKNKYLCEQELLNSGLPVTIVRPFYIYGPAITLTGRPTYSAD